MTVSAVLDSAGRRRSPATMPGYHAGRSPRNKGLRYPADPPTVEEIVAVMRQVRTDRHGARLRAVIVVLWRGGLRIQEALALAERDLDPRRGSILVRHGKGEKRREVGMDEWGFEQLRPWLVQRERLPIGPLLCVIDGPTRGRLVGRRRPGRVPRSGCASRGAAPLRATPAPSRACARARPRGRTTQHHPAPARPRQPRHDEHLPARDRHRGDHRDRPRKASADDAGECRPSVLRHPVSCGSAERRSRFILRERELMDRRGEHRGSSAAGVCCPPTSRSHFAQEERADRRVRHPAIVRNG
jgi:integrase